MKKSKSTNSRLVDMPIKLKRMVLGVASTFIIASGISSKALAGNKAPTSQQKPQVYKLQLESSELARKVSISFHHALLESNFDKNYLILDLTDQDLAKLAKFNLFPQASPLWQKRVENHLKDIQDKVAARRLQKTSTIAGIPGYECYPTVEETLTQGSQLATQYANLAEWIDIGDSWTKANASGGYDLMVLKITNKSITGEKPKLFIHSAMHARELTTAALTLDFAKLLLENYNSDADYQWVVDHHEVHILFHMNPDGRKIAETGVYQRKNTNQNHCPGSGVGVDLNRNFAFFWNSTPDGSSGNECDSTYRGSSAESEPETQAVSNYIRSLFPDVRGENEEDAAPSNTPGLHLDIHSYSELVLWPYGHTNTPSPNDAGFVELGNKLAWFNNYTPQQSVGLYPTDGTSDDVSYGELGVAALTFELGTSFFQQCGVYETSVKPDNLPALFYSAKVARAPYELSSGPEISAIKLNQADGEVTVPLGSLLELEVTASAARTKLLSNNRSISKVEYSVNTPVWDDNADLVEMVASDGNFNSSNEVATETIDTSSLTLGRHKIYFRAFNQNSQEGVPQAVFFNVAENGSPQAEFSVTCDELVCDFDATESTDPDGSLTEYEWDFNDGNSASGITVTHTFDSPGEKRITLTVTDNSDKSAVTNKQVTLVKKLLPIADFLSGCDNLNCEFDAASSTDPDGDIVSVLWDFGDGNTSSASYVTHNYAASGNYQVTLTVVDNDDLENSITKTVVASAPVTPPTTSSGGGSFWWTLPGLALFALRRNRKS